MRNARIILHVGQFVAILLDCKIRSGSRFSLEKATAELIDGLSIFLSVGDTAARVGSFAMGDEGMVRFEPLAAARATALIDWVDVLDVLLIFSGCIEVFADSVLVD
jgi:hypothetical protein